MATPKLSWNVALAGECMTARPFAVYDDKASLQVIDMLRAADLTYAHLEMNFAHFSELEYPARGDWTGSFMMADPAIARELKEAGIDMMSLAHNHSMDWGEAGVLAWNVAADKVFGFSSVPAERRNLLWLLFTAPTLRTLLDPWEDQALQILSSFRRDFVRAPQDPDIGNLVRDLEKVDPDFRAWWRQQDIHGPCQGIRHFQVPDIGPVVFDHTSLSIDVDRDLRLVYYAAREAETQSRLFEQWLQAESGQAQLEAAVLS